MTEGIAIVPTDVRPGEARTVIYLSGTYDIFISHCWRYDEEWTEMVALLDEALGRSWRNWSLPWYDPGLDRFTPEGRAHLVDTLDGQLSMCGALLALADICKGSRGNTWLAIQIEFAQKVAIDAVDEPLNLQQHSLTLQLQFVAQDRDIAEVGRENRKLE